MTCKHTYKPYKRSRCIIIRIVCLSVQLSIHRYVLDSVNSSNTVIPNNAITADESENLAPAEGGEERCTRGAQTEEQAWEIVFLTFHELSQESSENKAEFNV